MADREPVTNVRFGSLAALFVNISLMSAFPESGRSITQKTAETKVRFRPQADIKKAPPRWAGLCSWLTRSCAGLPAVKERRWPGGLVRLHRNLEWHFV